MRIRGKEKNHLRFAEVESDSVNIVKELGDFQGLLPFNVTAEA